MIRLAVLGCGDVAFRTYFPGLLALENRANVVAVCDSLRERAEQASLLFPGSTALTSIADLVTRSDIDGVLNLTPPPFHLSTTTALLSAGFHVFSEKPLATTVDEGQSLINHARATGRLLLCAPAVMSTPRILAIQKVIAGGHLGRVTHAFARLATMGPAGWDGYTGDPSVFYSTGVGPAIDLGVYLITTLTGLFGPAKRVQAMGGILIPERTITIPRLAGQKITVQAPDLISMNIEFENNRFATIISSYVMPSNQGPVLEIVGELGLARVRTESDYWLNHGFELYQPNASEFGDAGWVEAGPELKEPLLYSGPRHFLDVIEGKAEPIMTAAHALHVLEIMNAAELAITTGDSVSILKRF